MLRLLSVCVALLMGGVACAGPRTNGALWVQQYAYQEKTYFATNDAQRQEQSAAFERGMADEGLAAERDRLQADLQVCPGPSRPLDVSPGDVRRDGLRIQAGGDANRLAQLAQLALMDWYLRRASATSDAQFCDRARTASATGSSAGLLEQLPAATVSRARPASNETPNGDPPLVTLSRYALGSLDTVTATAPLPQYLAWVYGGTLLTSAASVEAETAAAMVDVQAPAYPDWEPDALYAALRGARP